MGKLLTNLIPLQEFVEIHFSIIAGICLITIGGWLDCTFKYRGWSFGFLKGYYLLKLRLRITSKKSVWIELVSIVTLEIMLPKCLGHFLSHLFSIWAGRVAKYGKTFPRRHNFIYIYIYRN